MNSEQSNAQSSRPEYLRKYNNLVTDADIPAGTVNASISNAVAQRHTLAVACDYAPQHVRLAFDRLADSAASSGSALNARPAISCCNCGGKRDEVHTAELIIVPITESGTHTSWNIVLVYEGSIAFSAKAITAPWRWINAVNEILKKIAAAAADLQPAGTISPFEQVFNSFHIVDQRAFNDFCKNRKLLDALS